MGTLLVITGPPGAGKSTVASLVANRYPVSVLVTGDAFFAFLAAGAIEPWLRESNEQNAVVTNAAAAATGRFVAGGYRTVYDGVLGPWFLDRFISGLGADVGTDPIDYAVLLPSLEVCLHRVATRSGHGFTDPDATAKMHDEFTGATVDERHVLADPPTTAEAVADLVVQRAAVGALTYRPSD